MVGMYVTGLREEFGPVGLDDQQLAWVAFCVAKIYATLASAKVGDISSVTDTNMSIYGLACGVLAGTYQIPGAGTPESDAASAASPPAPEANRPEPIGPYL